MHINKRDIRWLFLGIFVVSLIGWFSNTFIPDSVFKLGIFLLLMFSAVITTSLFLLNNVRRALLISLGVVIWLILRYFNLREFFYPLLLAGIIFSLELYFQKR